MFRFIKIEIDICSGMRSEFKFYSTSNISNKYVLISTSHLNFIKITNFDWLPFFFVPKLLSLVALAI